MKNKYIIFFIAVAVLSVLVASYYFKDVKISDENSDMPRVTEPPTPTISPNTLPDNSEFPISYNPNIPWVTFRNNDLGIEFKYPSEWGAVSIEEYEGHTGTVLYASFKNIRLKFWAKSIDYQKDGDSGLQSIDIRNNKTNVIRTEIGEIIFTNNITIDPWLASVDVAAVVPLPVSSYHEVIFRFVHPSQIEIDLFYDLLKNVNKVI